MKKKLTRREFLRLSTATVAGTVLAACAPAATDTPEPTATPEPEATDTPVPDATDTPAPTEPGVSTKQAPQLRGLVEAGDLPPLDERIPVEPFVLEPHHEIGEYGGTWRRAYKGVGDVWGPNKMIREPLMRWTQREGEEAQMIARFVQSWEVNDDATEYTFTLREGMKWSDGTPVTTADTQFWYEDLYLNEDTHDVSGYRVEEFEPGGELMQIEIVDDYTFKTIFAGPRPLLPMSLSIFVGSHNANPTFVTPSHFTKQFHPNYASEEEIQAALDEYGFDSYVQLVERGSPATFWFHNADVPVIYAWFMKTPPPGQRIVMERNPYFWMTDPEGNQYPYMDEITHDLFEDPEVFTFWLISGRIDCQERHVDTANYTLFKENESEGNYTVKNWLNARTYAFTPVPAYGEKDPVLGELFAEKDFRVALSLGIDREEINELVFDGLAEPRQACPVSGSPSYDEEWETLYIDYNPEEANALLDGLGLEERDGDGFRLRPDGERLSVTLFYASMGFHPPEDMMLLIQEYWQDVGIEVALRPTERTLYETMSENNEIQIDVWAHTRTFIPIADPLDYWGQPQYAEYLRTDGAAGVEPPEDHPVREIWDLYAQVQETVDEVQRRELWSQIMDINKEELWSIGVVGELPQPVIVHNRMRNVPEGLITASITQNFGLADPLQFWIAEEA